MSLEDSTGNSGDPSEDLPSLNSQKDDYGLKPDEMRQIRDELGCQHEEDAFAKAPETGQGDSTYPNFEQEYKALENKILGSKAVFAFYQPPSPEKMEEIKKKIEQYIRTRNPDKGKPNLGSKLGSSF